MKNLLLTFGLLISSFAYSQWVQIPDSNFRNALTYIVPTAIVGDSINVNDTSVTQKVQLSFINNNIHNLTGIHAFSNLKYLDVSSNYISFIPTLPDSIKHFSSSNNNIDSIGIIPLGLNYLNLDNNNLDSIIGFQNLPSTLKTLSLNNCNLDTIPQLPTNLLRLFARNNPIIDSLLMPTIPTFLKLLDISQCGLTYLDSIPNSIDTLYMDNNNIASLSIISDSLLSLSATNCGISNITQLPTSLEYLDVSSNNISLLNNLPNSLITLIANNSQIHAVSNLPSNLFFLNLNNNLLTTLTNLPNSLRTLKVATNLFTSNFTLNQGLENFDVSHNNIATSWNYPSSLLYLDISYSAYTSLNNLPTFIATVIANNNQIGQFTQVPATVSFLNISYNVLTTFPSTPLNMDYLNFSNNNITSLAALPTSVIELFISNNPIVSYPQMPQSVNYLIASNCNFPSIAQFPNGIIVFDVSNTTTFTNLPNTLPTTLTSLSITNTSVQCLPYLPNNFSNLNTDSTITCLPNLPLGLNSNSFYFSWTKNGILQLPDTTSSEPYTICNANNSSCIGYSRIAGKTFFDQNSNGIFDSLDYGIGNISLKLEPNQFTFAANNSGNYFVYVSPDTFNLKVLNTPNYFYSTTSDSLTIIISQMGVSDTINNFGFAPSMVVNDLEVYITPYSSPRPGITTGYNITYKNTGTTNLNSFISFTKDSKTTFAGSDNNNYVINGNNITWNLSNVNPFETGSFNVYLTTSIFAQMNEQIVLSAIINPVLNDTTFSNNFTTSVSNIVNSYDPNDKSANPVSITPQEITNNIYIEYLIRFQNTGNAEAIDIVVTDTISNNLNISTFNFITSSHNCNWKIDNNRVIQFEFKNINLPDSNTNELLSHGFIKFKIKANTDLLLGDEVQNTANIYFDFNEPIITNTIVSKVEITNNLIKTSLLEINIIPNPANDLIRIKTNNKNTTEIKIENSLGELIYTNESYNNNEVINLSMIKSGIYFVFIKSENGDTNKSKFIILK